MYSQQLADAALAAALAADTALQRLAAPEDHHRTQIAGARCALERVDDAQALCAFARTSAELAVALGQRDHVLIVEALCDLHAAAITLAARSHDARARVAGDVFASAQLVERAVGAAGPPDRCRPLPPVLRPARWRESAAPCPGGGADAGAPDA